MQKRKPCAVGKFLIVQLVKDKSSSIIIPETAQGAAEGSFYEIIDVGPKCENGVKKGDQIIIATQANASFKFEDQEYFTIHEDRIATVIR